MGEIAFASSANGISDNAIGEAMDAMTYPTDLGRGNRQGSSRTDRSKLGLCQHPAYMGKLRSSQTQTLETLESRLPLIF